MRKKRSLIKSITIWVGTLTIALILIIVGLGILLSPGELDFDSPYHPFRSQQARKEYLKLYDEKAKKWPVKSTTQMVSTSFGKTFVRISGSEANPPLVLMHGGGGNSLQWIPNVKTLSKHYRVFAVDNVFDSGRSIPSKAMTSANDYVAWLNEVFNALSLHDGINVVGLSYGGWITTQYALKFPERLNKIVLLAPAGTVAPLSLGWILRAVSVIIPLKYFTRNFIYWLAEDAAKSGKAGRALVEEHVEEAFLAVCSFKGKGMVNPSVLSDEELRSIKVPTLFVIGENEKIYSPKKVLERLKKVSPQIRTKLVNNAGHDLAWAQAITVNNLIIDFLRSKQ